MATTLRELELLSPLLNVTINPAGFTSITTSSSLGNFSPHHSTFFLSLHFPHSMPFSLFLPLHFHLVFVWFFLPFLSLTLELILIPLPTHSASAPIAFSPGIHRIQLMGFAPWGQSRIAWWESALLPVFSSSG